MTNLTATASSNEATPKKVAIYVRSNEKDGIKNESAIGLQLKTIKDYCTKKGYRIFEEYSDSDVTARGIKNRAGLQKLLKDAQDGCFNEVIVYRLGIIASNLRILSLITDNLFESQVTFQSILERLETETPMGKFQLQMLTQLYNYERDYLNQYRKSIKSAK